MEKKLTNNDPLRAPADKHSIYTIQIAFLANLMILIAKITVKFHQL
jgi:hypothetical protein